MQGMDPYGYVGGNPETLSDPTGQVIIGEPGGGSPPQAPPVDRWWSDPSGGSSGNPSSGFIPATPLPRIPPKSNNPPGELTSCGAPETQATCGDFAAWFALYLETGGEIGLPGNFCIDCGSFGGGPGDEINGSGSDLISFLEEGGADTASTMSSEDAGAVLAQMREELGMPPRSLEPDDGQTLAVLFADGEEYWGINGGIGKGILFSDLAAPAKDHAEIDALNQLYRDRLASGTSGGSGLMLVDRPPCAYCYTVNGRGAIATAVTQAELDRLETVYGSGINKRTGGVIPPGRIVLP